MELWKHENNALIAQQCYISNELDILARKRWRLHPICTEDVYADWIASASLTYRTNMLQSQFQVYSTSAGPAVWSQGSQRTFLRNTTTIFVPNGKKTKNKKIRRQVEFCMLHLKLSKSIQNFSVWLIIEAIITSYCNISLASISLSQLILSSLKCATYHRSRHREFQLSFCVVLLYVGSNFTCHEGGGLVIHVWLRFLSKLRGTSWCSSCRSEQS